MLGVGVLGPGVSVGGAEEVVVLQLTKSTSTKKINANRFKCINGSSFNELGGTIPLALGSPRHYEYRKG
jgi:hypothetical protein